MTDYKCGAGGEAHRLAYTLMKRCTLRRNVDHFPFTPALSTDTSGQLGAELSGVLFRMNDQEGYDWQLEALERESLAVAYQKGLLQTDPNQSNLVMYLYRDQPKQLTCVLNDREHLKWIAEDEEKSFEHLWQMVDAVDDYFTLRTPIAAHDKYGYLTSDLQYVGTGLTLEAICHLPALQTTGFIESISEAMKGIGVSITKKWDNFYWIRNMSTLGKSEFEMVLLLTQVLERLEEKESAGRATLVESRGDHLKDQAARAYGLLSHARAMAFDEALTLLSALWMGQDYGWIEVSKGVVTSRMALLEQLTPAALMNQTGTLSIKERDQERAQVIRDYMRGLNLKE